jgi:hypothetical protein
MPAARASERINFKLHRDAVDDNQLHSETYEELAREIIQRKIGDIDIGGV